ncbi:MAG: hypothetical protein ACRDKT_13315 [Actinomycetota bacterium]
MAASASGWLKPDGRSYRAVARRALELLGGFLDDDQREQVERFHGFAIVEGDRAYWIPLEGTPWCAYADDGRVEPYCIAPDERGGMPEADVSLTYLLWIRFDRAAFHNEANVLATNTIDWPDRESQLIEALAELATPKPLPPRRPRRKRSYARVRSDERPIATSLSEEQLRALFARHGRVVPDEIVGKLAR